jgi:hypothetical protein
MLTQLVSVIQPAYTMLTTLITSSLILQKKVPIDNYSYKISDENENVDNDSYHSRNDLINNDKNIQEMNILSPICKEKSIKIKHENINRINEDMNISINMIKNIDLSIIKDNYCKDDNDINNDNDNNNNNFNNEIEMMLNSDISKQLNRLCDAFLTVQGVLEYDPQMVINCKYIFVYMYDICEYIFIYICLYIDI